MKVLYVYPSYEACTHSNDNSAGVTLVPDDKLCLLCGMYIKGYCGVFYAETEHKTAKDVFSCDNALILWGLLNDGRVN